MDEPPEREGDPDALARGIGRRILRRYEELPISQSEVLRQADGLFGRTSLYNWEAGHSVPSTENLMALAEILECRLEWLVYGTAQEAAQEEWTAQLERLEALRNERGLTQTALAAMDDRLTQKDLSRWSKGDYKVEPTAPKMAAVRSLVAALAGAQQSNEYVKGAEAALAAVEGVVADFRSRLHSLEAARAAASSEAARRAEREDAERQKGAASGQGGPHP